MVPSYLQGSSGTPLIGQTIGAALDQVAAAYGERQAVVSVAQDIRLTYADLKREADLIAAGLLDLNLSPGERIGIWSVNRAEWTIIQYAAAKAGLILVTINPAYKLRELEQVLNLAGCAALVVGGRFKTSDYVTMVEALVPNLRSGGGAVSSLRAPALRVVIALDDAEGDGLLHLSAVRAAGARIGTDAIPDPATMSFDDPINIQFTSGTTGAPKGVTLSHHNILNNGIQTGAAAGISAGDRVCIPVPLFHCFGMVVGNLACLGHAATAVYPGEASDPLAIMQAVAAERCTHLYGVPTTMIAILAHERFGEFNLSSLRGGIMGGAPCPVETMKSVMAELHMPEVTIIYGMTETSPVSFQTKPDDPLDVRLETVGRIMPHLEAKVVDDDDRVVPVGQSGQLCTRGYSVMSGYWGEPEKTVDVLGPDRWMHTGDLATIDAEGHCRIIGRSKDIVIRGGENISPREIEEYLHTHPAILDVQVVGVPDPKFGEELCAWIVLKQSIEVDADAIRAFCQGRIAHFKIPRHIRFVDGFPMTASGKTQKFVIRQQMIEALASGGLP